MNGRLIEIDEIIAEADRRLRLASIPDEAFETVRDWYDRTLADRTEARSVISTPVGDLVVDHRYMIEYKQHRYAGRPSKTITLKDWTVLGRYGFSDRYVSLQHRRPGERWGGATRALPIQDITSITELT